MPARVDAATLATRTVLIAGALAIGWWGGFVLFYGYGVADGADAIDVLRAVLIFLSTFWLAWGALQSVAGLVTRPPRRPRAEGPLRARTVVLVPVCNENPVETFARIAAMDASLQATGHGAAFDFAVLSDTRDEAVAAEERRWFARLLADTGGSGRMFYRRRAVNRGRKAGNIRDFIERSGAAWEYAVILDADSLMEGETLVELVRRMEAAPEVGLIQTLPQIVRAATLFGRIQQFSAALYAPVFSRGLAMMQGRTGPFWGHNAIVRIRAFAESCGLPQLSGRPPFGGDILSHDYVEAALLARAGWVVRLDDDLGGSFEEGPANIVLHARRDRRWCQGNLQHARLLSAPGLPVWSRFVFLQGILAYVSPVFWLMFLAASIVAPLFAPEPDYFPIEGWSYPVFPVPETWRAIALAVCVFGLLFLPKLLILAESVLRGRSAGFGGSRRTAAGVWAELLFSAIVAPVFLMFTVRSVLQVLAGADGGWPAQNRSDGRLSLVEAWHATHWIVATGIGGFVASFLLAPHLALWLAPVLVPMLAAPAIVAWSSRPSHGPLFAAPAETAPPAILVRHAGWLARWEGRGADGTTPEARAA
jgi:membrane glycosyltransferase